MTVNKPELLPMWVYVLAGETEREQMMKADQESGGWGGLRGVAFERSPEPGTGSQHLGGEASQARSRIGDVALGLHLSHINVRPEPASPILNPASWVLVRFVFPKPQQELIVRFLVP